MRRLDASAPVGDAELTDDDLLELYAAPADAATWVRMMVIASTDGAASVQGLSGGLGSAADRRVFALARRDADVILVGAGTVRAEGYEGELLDAAARRWRTGRGLPAHPGVAVVSGRLGLDPDAEFFTRAPVRPLVLTTRSGLDRDASTVRALGRVADLVPCGDERLDPNAAVTALVERGHRVVHGEGGPALFGALAREGLVDELQLSLSPLLAGPDGPRVLGGPSMAGDEEPAESTPTALRLAHVLEEDSMLLLRYLVDRP